LFRIIAESNKGVTQSTGFNKKSSSVFPLNKNAYTFGKNYSKLKHLCD